MTFQKHISFNFETFLNER